MSVIERYYKDILYYQIEGFNSDEDINHVFSTRIGWEQNKLFDKLSYILNISRSKIYSAKQVHGTDVAVITDNNVNITDLGEKDGLVTNVKGIALSTYHADCVPIYYYDKEKSVIGIAHAGWKGTLNNINKFVLEKMSRVFDCKLDTIKVAIGPSIGPCCYEIGHDVEELFTSMYPNNTNIIKRTDDKMHLDLWKVNMENLLKIGIDEKNIYLSEKCTSCNIDKLYSYRREKGTDNRMIAAIVLKP